MEIKTYSPLEQVDPAVDLGAIQEDLPDWPYIEDIAANPHPKPPELIAGLLHQGCKMILGGTSKSNKSWCLLDMAMSVASGQEWWGRRCIKAPVIYIWNCSHGRSMNGWRCFAMRGVNASSTGRCLRSGICGVRAPICRCSGRASRENWPARSSG